MSNNTLAGLLEEIENEHGFITEDVANSLLEHHQGQTRLLTVLVRFRDARCLCALQYLETFVRWANLSGSHCRDVTIPTNAADWQSIGFSPKRAGYLGR